VNLVHLQSDPGAFRDAVVVDTDGGARALGAVADAWQSADFRALDAAWLGVAKGKADGTLRRAWLERPRGHAKTSDLAVMATWALFASRRTIRGVGAAADEDQARLLRDGIESVVRLNPWLAQILDVQAGRVVNRHTGSTLTIITSDGPTSYGLLPDFVVCDEVVHWRTRDLWDSLLSSAAKRAHCLLLVITNAGFAESWQWQTRESVRRGAGWYFSRLDGPCATWIDAGRLAEQERLLPPVAYARLWLNQWSSGAGDALEASLIDAAVTLESIPGPQLGFTYCAGLDIGISRDASALVVVGKSVGHVERRAAPARRLCSTIDAMVDLGMMDAPAREDDSVYHPGDGKLRVVAVRTWKPTRGGKVDLEHVERAVRELHNSYRLSSVAYDPYQCEFLAQRLRKSGIAAAPVHPSGNVLQAIATATLDAFRDGQIALYRDVDLLADLRSLRVIEKSYGFRLDSPRRNDTEAGTRHADTATALGLALYTARRVRMPAAARGSLVLHSPAAALARALEYNKLSQEELAELSAPAPEDDPAARVKSIVKEAVVEAVGGKPSPTKVFSGVRVKAGSESYKTDKKPALHVKSGKPVFLPTGEQATLPSELETAKAGVFLKMVANRCGLQAPMSDHERDLLGEMFTKDLWCGTVAGEHVTDLPGGWPR